MMSQLSLITTFTMLVCCLFGGVLLQLWVQQLHVPSCGQGMKIAKCGDLSMMWDYRTKQKKKIVELLKSLGKQATREGTEACMLKDKDSLAGRAGPHESVEMKQW